MRGCLLYTSSLSRNQTGISAGGPFYIPGLYRQREKTFIFGLFEHLTLSTPTADTYTVPDTKFQSGDFSEILGANTGKLDNLGRPIYVGQIYDPRSACLLYTSCRERCRCRRLEWTE